MGRKEQVMSHKNEDTGVVKHYAVERIMAAVKDQETKGVNLTPHLVASVCLRGGVELPRVKRFDEKHRDLPILLMMFANETALVLERDDARDLRKERVVASPDVPRQYIHVTNG